MRYNLGTRLALLLSTVSTVLLAACSSKSVPIPTQTISPPYTNTNSPTGTSSPPYTALPLNTQSPTDTPTSIYHDRGVVKIVKVDDKNRNGYPDEGEYVPGYKLTVNGQPLILPPVSEPSGTIKIGDDYFPYALLNGSLFLYLPEGTYKICDPLYQGWIRVAGKECETREITAEAAALGELVNPPVVFVNLETGKTGTPTATPTPTPPRTPHRTPSLTPSMTPTFYLTPTVPNTPYQPSETPRPTDTPKPPTLTPTNTPPTPSVTPTPTPVTPTDTPTPPPTDTSTPVPSETPTEIGP